MKKRFSPDSLQMAKAIDSFIKLNFDDSSFFVDNYKVTIRIFKTYNNIVYYKKNILFYFAFL